MNTNHAASLAKIIFELLVKGKVKTQSRFWCWNLLFALDDSKKGGRHVQMEWAKQKKKTKRATMCVCVSEYVLPLSLPRRCRETPRARYPLRRRCGGCLFSFVLAFSGSRPAIDKRWQKVTCRRGSHVTGALAQERTRMGRKREGGYRRKPS